MNKPLSLAAFAATFALAACGGGGESLSSTPMPPPPSASEHAAAATPAAPQPPATVTTNFACENGLKIRVVFDNVANTATVTTDKLKDLVLPARTTGSGYWYSDGRHGIRGKGKDAQWEVGRALPVKCTEA
jgi:membrane-bound inhibitor of C-type lysozyme